MEDFIAKRSNIRKGGCSRTNRLSYWDRQQGS
jgi:hypothetical protein